MGLIPIMQDNLAREHICGAISGEKDPQVLSETAWLNDRRKDGLAV